MTSLLEHPLVRKYFLCMMQNDLGVHDHLPAVACNQAMAYRVLSAMEQPLELGDRILEYSNDCSWQETSCKNETYIQDVSFHPRVLRLPDSFQKPEKEEPYWAGFTREQIDHLAAYCKALDKTPEELWEFVRQKPEPKKCYVCDDIKDFRDGAILPVCDFHLRNPPVKPDPVEDFRKQFAKAAEEAGEYIYEKFLSLARKQ